MNLPSNEIHTKILCLFGLGYPIYSWFGTWCLLTLLLVWILSFKSWKNNFKLSQVAWFFSLYFLLHLFGLLYSADIGSGIDDLQSKSTFLLVPIVFAGIDFTVKQRKSIVYSFVVGTIAAGIIYLSYAAYQYFFLGAPSAVFFYSHLTSPFKNHTGYISSYSVFAIIYLLNKLCKKRLEFTFQTILIASAILFLWIMVVLYAGRMQFFILPLLVALFIIWRFYSLKNLTKILLAIFVILGLQYTFANTFDFSKKRLESAVKDIGNSTNEVTQKRALRLDLWEAAISLFQDNPVLGAGTGDVDAAYDERFVEKFPDRNLKGSFNAHNQYLQSAMALGIFGLLAYLLLLGLPALHAIKAGNIVLLSFYLIFILGTLTECMLETQRGSVWLVVLGSLFWQHEKE